MNTYSCKQCGGVVMADCEVYHAALFDEWVVSSVIYRLDQVPPLLHLALITPRCEECGVIEDETGWTVFRHPVKGWKAVSIDTLNQVRQHFARLLWHQFSAGWTDHYTWLRLQRLLRWSGLDAYDFDHWLSLAERWEDWNLPFTYSFSVPYILRNPAHFQRGKLIDMSGV